MIEPNEYRVSRAVERAVNYDAWFTSEVKKGSAAPDLGDFTDHQAIRVMIETRYPTKR